MVMCCFSWEKHNAIVKEHDIGLTMTEFSLLGCLMEHGGTAIPGMNLDKVWGIDSTEIETRVVDETVRRVRQKMRPQAAKFALVLSGAMAINWRIVMNKTRYKIATLTGSAVMAAMLLSLLILNIVFNKKNRAES